MIRLKKAVENKNPEELHKVAHILKGNTGMMKATTLFYLYEKLVHLGRSGTVEGAEKILKTVALENKTVMAELEKML